MNSALSGGSAFEGFIQFGRTMMAGVDRNERPSIKYKWLLAQIDDLFTETHRIVMKRLDAVMAAQSVGEATQLIQQLSSEALDRTFRAQGMCDAFDGLGRALNQLTWTMEQEGSITKDQSDSVQGFTTMLMGREGEVSLSYEHQILELARLVHEPAADVSSIKQQATAARRVLVDQLADFEAQAAKFKQLVQD